MLAKSSLNAPRQLSGRQPAHPAAASLRRVTAAASAGKGGAGSKGFGTVKQQPKKAGADGCPCGSGKTYKECCKKQHSGASSAPTVEETIRARFCAVLKKDVPYLLKTTSPFFHSFHYGTEPGAALRQLQDDLFNTVDFYEYSNLKIREVRKSDNPDEATAVFQYTVYDKRTPLLDEQNNPVRKVQIEESRFTRSADSGSLWLFTDYKLVEVPEALAKTAEMQAQDMAAAAAAAGGGSSSSGDGSGGSS